MIVPSHGLHIESLALLILTSGFSLELAFLHPNHHCLAQLSVLSLGTIPTASNPNCLQPTHPQLELLEGTSDHDVLMSNMSRVSPRVCDSMPEVSLGSYSLPQAP